MLPSPVLNRGFILMDNKKPLVPIGLPISAVILFIVGAVAEPLRQALLSEEQLNELIFLQAIPFISIFIGIILIYISIIWISASLLNYKVNYRLYKTIEAILVGGIVLGVIGMFQPAVFVLYRIGFHMLLFCTIGFILWSHIIPGSILSSEVSATEAE